MKLNERFDYSSPAERKRLTLPGGNRMVVCPIVVLESWSIDEKMPRQVVPTPPDKPAPDYLNWTWHEYGMRIGFWRLLKLFKNLQIQASTSINSEVCQRYPQVAQACLDAGWEFVAHGVRQQPVHKLPDELAMIQRCMDEIEAFTGRRPRGWASPGISQNEESLDRLADAGIDYGFDWIMDDQPCELKTSSSPVLSIPYTVYLNDTPVVALKNHSIEQYVDNICRSFDVLYDESADFTSVMTIVLHPYICGAAHNIRHVERALAYLRRDGVLFWSGSQITDWFRCQA